MTEKSVSPPADGVTSTTAAGSAVGRWDRAVWADRLDRGKLGQLVRGKPTPVIPGVARARFTAMLIPEETIDRALAEVFRIDDWVGAWSRAAQRFLSEARREESTGHWYASAVARRNAAMCYHVAHLITEDDPRTVRTLRAFGVQSFSQAIPQLWPETRKVQIHWRIRDLPAYLAKPVDAAGPAPLVTLLNGPTTTKEELLLWATPLLERGLAVLTLDWPGTGEATDGHPLSSHCEDLTVGIQEFADAEPGIDGDALALIGISLGGVVAVRAAASERRIRAVVAVTPSYDPRQWAASVSPDAARQMLALPGQLPSVAVLLSGFSIYDVIQRLRSPLLVIGGGRDAVIPPEEAMRLAAAAGDLGTLIWYPEGGHSLYDHVRDWMSVAAEWLASVLDIEPVARDLVDVESTRVEDDITLVTAETAADASQPPDQASDEAANETGPETTVEPDLPDAAITESDPDEPPKPAVTPGAPDD